MNADTDLDWLRKGKTQHQNVAIALLRPGSVRGGAIRPDETEGLTA
jgi:hypothetical protein